MFVKCLTEDFSARMRNCMQGQRKIDYATFRTIIKSGGSLFWLLAYPSFTGMETLQNGEA